LPRIFVCVYFADDRFRLKLKKEGCISILYLVTSRFNTSCIATYNKIIHRLLSS